MAVSISATLLSGSPAPVQVVVTGVPVGEPFEVRGQLGMDSWPVPGGRGVGDGSQLVLVDSRAPLRSAVTYTVTTSEDRVYAWTGVPDASASTMTTAAGTVTNLATNPSFETASGTVEVARNYVRDYRLNVGSGWFNTPATSQLRTTEAPEGAGWAVRLTRSAVGAATVTSVFPLPPAGQRGLSIWARGNTPLPLIDLGLQESSVGYRWISRIPSTILSEEWTEIRLTEREITDVTPNVRVILALPTASAIGDWIEIALPTVSTYGTPPFDFQYSPDPDLLPSWSGAVHNSASILTATRAAGTGVGWQSQQWSATGENSHYIPQGSVQEYVISAGESFQIQPRTNGQTYLVNGDPHVTTDQPVHVNGPAMIETGQGWWDSWMHTDQPYQGNYWDGNTVSGVVPVSATSTPVTVPYPEKYVIQSLDGRQKVDFVWRDNGLPRDPYIDNAAFSVPGRRRPPVRFAPGGDGTGSLEVRVDRANGETLHEMLMDGRPMVVRTDGQVRDLKAVDVIMLTAAPNILFEGDGGISTQRIWSLSYLLVDDPEPDVVLAASTWDDFDEIYSATTWNQFDAEWAGRTWDEFDREDWQQRL